MMKILFKYPTRQRPAWFRDTLCTYYQHLSRAIPFQFLITMDEDDVEMNNEEMRVFLSTFDYLSWHYGTHENKIAAVNAGMELADNDWDIVVLVSDDMVPIMVGFDAWIAKRMQQHFPDTDGALHFHDGLYGRDRTITLSILGRALYETLGYIYHPDYKSFFCDNEFTEVVRAMGKVVYEKRVIIQHKWTGGPSSADALYRRNSKMGLLDEQTYKKRQAVGFPRESVL